MFIEATAPAELPLADANTLPLLAELLESQSRLQTPVARLAARHAPAGQIRAFSEPIPTSLPGPGEQYAFEVDLDRCSGCKACVSACHSLNGLDENETWRDVGAIFGGTVEQPYQQTITSACHHCADPGCLNGCPVLAYEKDPVTGIVRHVDDQCIGCQYCILKCPYDVPKYNARLGIVRKCDLCHSRLAVGESPACVQACPTHAIRVVKVIVSEARPNESFLAAAPRPELTKPTTRYVSKFPIPNDAAAVDATSAIAQDSHLPLVAMLVMTQLGVGLLLPALAKQASSPAWAAPTGTALYTLGLGASVLHLGQPLRAWRVFLNLRHSWLSREAVALGAAVAPLALWWVTRAVQVPPAGTASSAALATVTTALVGVFCSAMLYVDTGRRNWSAAQTFPRFFGTLVVPFAACMNPGLAALLIGAKLAFEATDLRSETTSPIARRTRTKLLTGSLRSSAALRFAAGALAAGAFAVGSIEIGLLSFAVGEFIERLLFFKTVERSKMPGVTA